MSSSFRPLADTQPFIDLEYNTVPLKGSAIDRDEHGKKHGYTFYSNWYDKFSKERNEVCTPIGGLITSSSSVVAIDCDCKASYDLFRQLDPTNTAYFDSIGKLDKDGNLLECGTILYKATPDLPPSKKLKGEYDLDWFNGTGTVFLPTEANSTKSHWYIKGKNLYNSERELVEIKPMPEMVQTVLKLIIAVPKETEAKSVSDTTLAQRSKGYLGRLLQDFNLKKLILEGEYEPKLTKALTPKDFRTDLYYKQGHLHPKDAGQRHEYLFKIMCTLAGDNTVDKDTAIETIMYINSLLDPPRSSAQMHSEIIDAIISGRQKNAQGESYWEYDEHWEATKSFNITTKGGDYLDIFYDLYKKTYYVYNTHNYSIDLFTGSRGLLEHLRSISSHGFNQQQEIENMTNVETIVDPTEDFGYLEFDTQFNMFEPTEALRILADPTEHESHYREPIEFIQYMEGFIPDSQQREYFLSLLRTKLTTFSYSPVVPYIIGIPGSGKGILMSILTNLIGNKYVSKDVPGSQVISDFNRGWLENKYFVNLNELSDGLANKDRDKALSNLKQWTGSMTFQCHGKGKDAFEAPQNAMFIMTSNKSPLNIDDNDRRVYYIETPNTFKTTQQCLNMGTTNIYKAIMAQTNDIAYYLATEIENLKGDDYTTAPHHSGRAEIVFSSLFASAKIAWALKNKEFERLAEYLLSPDLVFSDIASGRVHLEGMTQAFSEMSTHNEAPDIAIKRAMKEEGFKQKQGYKNAVYWEVDGLQEFEYNLQIPTDEDAEEIRV